MLSSNGLGICDFCAWPDSVTWFSYGVGLVWACWKAVWGSELQGGQLRVGRSETQHLCETMDYCFSKKNGTLLVATARVKCLNSKGSEVREKGSVSWVWLQVCLGLTPRRQRLLHLPHGNEKSRLKLHQSEFQLRRGDSSSKLKGIYSSFPELREGGRHSRWWWEKRLARKPGAI